MNDKGWRLLLGTAFVIQVGLYAWLFDLSNDFEYNRPTLGRPVILIFVLFTICFALHLLALIAALRLSSTRSLWWFLFAGATVFRLVMLPSEPIQEVDIYRYCWDGHVLRHGISPFRYSPSRALTANENEAGLTQGLRTLIQQRDGDDELEKLLSRVHFGELTTIYPPVSQVVFAVADLLTPAKSTLALRLLIMKFVVVVFDLLTLAMLAKLLAMLKKHVGWSIVYGWSPLVLKEFANSGHLDSIAVALCVAAILVATRSFLRSRESVSGARLRHFRWCNSAGLLALAVGAKLFPIVLAPLMAAAMWKFHGFRKAIAWSVAFGLTTLAVLSPMLLAMRTDAPDARPLVAALAQDAAALQDLNASVPASSLAVPPTPSLTAPSVSDSMNGLGGNLEAATGQPESSVSGLEDIDIPETFEPPLPNDDGLIEFLSRWE
ncbi:MAG: hypothetical protein AAGG44_08490, partial [Planctomycetota bacterium]